MIKAFLDSLGKTFTRKTVVTHRQLISQTMALAILGGDITFNPTDARYRTAGRPSAQREEAPARDQQIISEFWNEDMYSRLGFLIKCTGLRKGEALALQYRDIDNQNRIIHISKSVYFTSNTPHIKQPKTKAGIRRVVMLDSLYGKFVGEPEKICCAAIRLKRAGSRFVSGMEWLNPAKVMAMFNARPPSISSDTALQPTAKRQVSTRG